MARRQDSGGNSPHENPRPNNEERIPEFTDNVRSRADEGDDLNDETDDFDDEVDDTDDEEGTI